LAGFLLTASGGRRQSVFQSPGTFDSSLVQHFNGDVAVAASTIYGKLVTYLNDMGAATEVAALATIFNKNATLATRWIDRVFTTDVFKNVPKCDDDNHPPLPTNWTTDQHDEYTDVRKMWGTYWAELLVKDLEQFVALEKARRYDVRSQARAKPSTAPAGDAPKWTRKQLPTKYMEAYEQVKQKQHVLLDSLDVLIKGNRANALHVTGRAGTGKSHTIKEYLEKVYKEPPNVKQGKWKYKQGGITQGGVFEYCRKAKDKVIVFDDVIQLFSDKANRKYLLALMAPGQERIVSYDRQVTPSKKNPKKSISTVSYHFTGKIITIANVGIGGDPVMDAIADRCSHCELDYTPEEMEAFLTHIACGGSAKDNLSPDECLHVLSLIVPVFEEQNCRLTLRWYLDKALPNYSLSKQGIGTRTNWLDRLMEEVRREKTEGDAEVVVLTMDQKKKIMDDIVIEAYTKFPKREQLQDRLKMWAEETKARLKESRQKGMYHATVKKLRAEGRLDS
jgi:hypothetical protein